MEVKLMLCPECSQEVPEGKFCDLCSADLSDMNLTGTTRTAVSEPGKTRGASTLDRYELTREIGRGGMGIVYEAKNKPLNKKVAIKKMKEEIKIRPREKARFLSEATTVAELHHPNIVDIYDIIEDKEDIYLVFEYIDGKTVEKIVDEKGKFALKETVRIIDKVCDALKYSHEHRVVHRDLKPSNIMISKDGYVKVMDFGIAREAKDTISSVSGQKETSGTLAYMAPEQHIGSYNTGSDIYSLGVTLYEMLTGEVPFRGVDLYEQKKQMSYRQPTEIVSELPVEVDEIIKKCLQKDTENRYHSAEEFMNELEKVSDKKA